MFTCDGEDCVVLTGYGENCVVLPGYGENSMVLPGYGENRVVFTGYGDNRVVLASHGKNRLVLTGYGEDRMSQHRSAKRQGICAFGIGNGSVVTHGVVVGYRRLVGRRLRFSPEFFRGGLPRCPPSPHLPAATRSSFTQLAPQKTTTTG